MATSNLVGRWATAEHFYALERRGLTIWGGYTAADWQYIGSQGIVQGTYQTFAAVAAEHFGGSLAGRLVVTAGLGGMGGAQPLAIALAGGVALCVEVDAARIRRRRETGYLDRETGSLDEALGWVEAARARGEGLSIGLLGNAAEVLPALARKGVVPDVVTDQTSAHDLLHGYVPPDMTLERAAMLREREPETLMAAARAGIADHVRAMLAWQAAGAVAFEYGNNIRAQARRAGWPTRSRSRSSRGATSARSSVGGIGPFRWVAVSGAPEDIAWIDDLVLREVPDNRLATDWIRLARRHVRFQGLPARIAWLGHGERSRLALAVNRAVGEGVLRGPVAFTRDHLDAGGVAQPYRETEGMPDGSDAVADWPLLDALAHAAPAAPTWSRSTVAAAGTPATTRAPA